MPNKVLPETLRNFIDGHVENVSGGSDPLYSDDAVKHLTRLTRSSETRAGLILQRSIVEGLRRGAEYTVLTPRAFPVCAEPKQQLFAHDIDFVLGALHLPVTKAVSTTEIDLIAIRHRDRSAAVYEIRRANGRLGWKATRDALLKLASAKMLLRDWILRECGIVVDNTAAYLVAYFGNLDDVQAVFPPQMVLTRDNLDQHFGLPVRELVDAANELYGRHVDQAVAKVVKSMKEGRK